MIKLRFSGLIVCTLALTTILAGCDAQIAQAPESAPTSTSTAMPAQLPTNTPEPAPTDTPPPANTPTPLPTDTPAPTNTPEPTATPEPPTATPTPDTPAIIVNTDLNLRAGPGTEYAWVGQVTNETRVEVVGRNEDESWWQIVHPDGSGNPAWIADGYGEAINVDGVPVVQLPPTPTPAAPTATPVPTQPPVDFVVAGIRLWHNEENGGWSPGGSVTNCGYGHEIHVQVVDAHDAPLDGVVIADTYNNPRTITGSHGPGRTQYILYFNGYELYVAEDGSAGRPVTSETSQVLSAKESEIPIPWLIEAGYCATEEECQERISKNALCQGHYSWDITFKRTW